MAEHRPLGLIMAGAGTIFLAVWLLSCPGDSRYPIHVFAASHPRLGGLLCTLVFTAFAAHLTLRTRDVLSTSEGLGGRTAMGAVCGLLIVAIGALGARLAVEWQKIVGIAITGLFVPALVVLLRESHYGDAEHAWAFPMLAVAVAAIAMYLGVQTARNKVKIRAPGPPDGRKEGV